MKSDKQMIHALTVARWTRGDDRQGAYWTAPPGKGPPGPWMTRTAFRYLVRGDASRVLAAKGWNVAGEYVGEIDRVSVGDHVLHAVKAPKFITIRAALKREGLPAIAWYESAACERGK